MVQEGRADAVVSVGQYRRDFRSRHFQTRTYCGVDRGGIATIIPRAEGEFVLVDSGANIECKPVHLAHYAVMGSIYSREILHRPNPRVGILSVGTEDSKGNELTLQAFQLCKQLDLNFIGNVEGHDLFKDRVDVVICDGFVGNIVLKTCESLAFAMFSMLKHELTANPRRKLGALLAQNAFRAMRRKMDPEGSGGAPLLGFNGAVMKAHGSARERSIANAIRVATENIHQQVNQTIEREIGRANERLAALEPAAAPRTVPRLSVSNPANLLRAPQGMSPTPTPKFRNPRAKYNFQGRTCSIAGVGSYVPDRVLTNANLEKMVSTSDEWITTRPASKSAISRPRTSLPRIWPPAPPVSRCSGPESPRTKSNSLRWPPLRRTCRFLRPPAWCSKKSGLSGPRPSTSRRPAPGLSTVWKCPAVHHVPHLRHGAGHRRGETLLHRGLAGPQHLRALRRRGRRGRAAQP